TKHPSHMKILHDAKTLNLGIFHAKDRTLVTWSKRFQPFQIFNKSRRYFFQININIKTICLHSQRFGDLTKLFIHSFNKSAQVFIRHGKSCSSFMSSEFDEEVRTILEEFKDI